MKYRFSVVVAARDLESCEATLASLRRLELGDATTEVLVATGNRPSLQRNLAVQQATGDFLLFLDNDSIVSPKLIHYYLEALRESTEEIKSTEVVGGPSVYESDDNDFASSVQCALTSVFGLGPARARYFPLGPVRLSSERELILSNLVISHRLFLQEGGFNENLYPNEENEFLSRIENKTKIVYHPLAIVYRTPRKTWIELIGQMLRYGHGRFQHFRVRWSFSETIYLIPAFFSIYVIASLSWVATGGSLRWLVPLAIYFVSALAASGVAAASTPRPKVILRLPWIFFICHFFYGVGLILGIFIPTIRPKNDEKVTITRIRDFEGSFS